MHVCTYYTALQKDQIVHVDNPIPVNRTTGDRAQLITYLSFIADKCTDRTLTYILFQLLACSLEGDISALFAIKTMPSFGILVII